MLWENRTSQYFELFFGPKRTISQKNNLQNTVLPGKNPGENLWKDTDITFEVKEKASSTPANNFHLKDELVRQTSIVSSILQQQRKIILLDFIFITLNTLFPTKSRSYLLSGDSGLCKLC